MNNVSSKVLIAFFIVGLLIATTACSKSNTNNIAAPADKSSINAASPDKNVAAPKKTAVESIPGVQKVADVKHVELLNQTVTVRGMVLNNFKMGSLSGYRLKDGSDSIPISSKNLATINTTVTVTGTLKTSSYFGFYIQVKE